MTRLQLIHEGWNFALSVTVSTNPGAKISKCTEEVNLTEVRAKGFHEVELGVGALPEHEVAQPLLA